MLSEIPFPSTNEAGSLAAGAILPRRARVDRKRVHAPLEFRSERGVDHAMAFDPALSPEGLRHNINPVMRLPARPVACVALVLMRFIDDAQA